MKPDVHDMHSINVIDDIDIITRNTKSDIIVVVKTNAENIIKDDYKKILYSISQQSIYPMKIVLNIDRNKITKEINEKLIMFKREVNNIDLLFSNNTIKSIMKYISSMDKDGETRIVFIDDSCYLKFNCLWCIELCYQLYQCDIVSQINSNKNVLFYDKINSIIDVNKVYSFKYKFIKKISEFIERTKNYKFDNDPLFITIFYLKYRLYNCAINCKLRESLYNSRKQSYNMNLFNNVLNYEKILWYNDTNFDDYDIKVPNKIVPRYLLNNLDNYKIVNEEWYITDVRHVDIKIINSNTLCLTVTKFEENVNSNQDILIEINGKVYTIKIIDNIKKYTQLLKITDLKIKRIIGSDNLRIMQTTHIVNLPKLYTICSILSYIPYYTYYMFYDNDIVEYFKEHNPILLPMYLKLVPGAYKSDYFRAIYMYENSGFYFDCKQILFRDMNSIIENGCCFVKDRPFDFVYNGFFYVDSHFDRSIFRNYIHKMTWNILNECYAKCPLEITGPAIFGKYFKTNHHFKVTDYAARDHSVYLDTSDREKYIKHSYYGYYDQNYDGKVRVRYHELWYDRKVFRSGKINYDIFNDIDLIIQMVSEDKKICELDGKVNLPIVYKNKIPKSSTSSDFENEDNLNLIKIFSFVDEIKSKFSIIFMEQVGFKALELFNIKISKVINSAPAFDILVLSKKTNEKFNKIFTPLNKSHLESMKIYSILVTKEFVEKFRDFAIYRDKKFFINNKQIVYDNIFANINFKTFIYKYNICYPIEDELNDIHTYEFIRDTYK